MLLDGDRHVAQHVFGDAHLALHLVDGSGRGIDVHEDVMRLAVLLDAVGEGLQAPVFGTPDLAAICFDDALVLLKETIDLLCGHILPGKEHVFIKSHWRLAFLASSVDPGPAPSLNDCS